jgi:hypothetical protein
MRKFIVSLVVAEILSVMSAIGSFGLDAAAKKSIYLPNNSWVISKLEAKLQELSYSPAEGWKDSVVASYDCVDSMVPEADGEVSTIFKKTNTIGLYVSMKNDPFLGTAVLSVEVKFKKPVDDIVTKIKASEAPAAEEYELKISNLGSGGLCERELGKMEEKEADVLAQDFTFDAQTKVYSAGMGSYTQGFVLVDKNNKKMFWCCKEVGKFKEGEFYKLNDVLDGYKKYEQATKDLQQIGGHPTARWVL